MTNPDPLLRLDPAALRRQEEALSAVVVSVQDALENLCGVLRRLAPELAAAYGADARLRAAAERELGTVTERELQAALYGPDSAGEAVDVNDEPAYALVVHGDPDDFSHREVAPHPTDEEAAVRLRFRSAAVDALRRWDNPTLHGLCVAAGLDWVDLCRAHGARGAGE